MTAAAFNQALFDDAVSAMPVDALSGLRKKAAARFSDSGFPTTRHEDWRYTNLARVVAVSNNWLANTNRSLHVPANPATLIRSAIDAHWILLQNGKLEFDADTFPTGVSVTLLSAKDANSEFEDVAIEDPLAQFNAALLNDGLKISVESGTKVDKPIGFLIDDHAGNGAAVAQSRVLINIQDGATAQFVEAHVSTGDGEHFANNVVQFTIAANSIVDYLRVQQRARHHMNTNRLIVDLAENATFNHCAFDFGGSLIRNDIAARLKGRHSNVALNGLYLAGDQQHIDNHTRVDHLVGPSRSTEEYRGILNRKSRCVFNGKAIVHRGADETDANQSNHNLLLSEDAEIDTKPELEIYADEVKCSHGATVGQLDETALFYLRSRGLDIEEATRLITRAFAAKVLSLLTVDAAREYIAGAIDARLDVLIGRTDDE